MKFKVGDRVYDKRLKAEGVVVSPYNNEIYGVDFKRPLKLFCHNLEGRLEGNTGRYCWEHELSLTSPKKTLIYRKGE